MIKQLANKQMDGDQTAGSAGLLTVGGLTGLVTLLAYISEVAKRTFPDTML
jgi:hypothetical protein